MGLDPPLNTYHFSVFACRLVRFSLGETRVGMSFLLIKSSVSVFPRKMVWHTHLFKIHIEFIYSVWVTSISSFIIILCSRGNLISRLKCNNRKERIYINIVAISLCRYTQKLNENYSKACKGSFEWFQCVSLSDNNHASSLHLCLVQVWTSETVVGTCLDSTSFSITVTHHLNFVIFHHSCNIIRDSPKLFSNFVYQIIYVHT